MSEEPKNTDTEMEEQLDYLFAESNEEGGEPGGASRRDPLRELKAIFLAVDWEINDDIMSAMLRQIESLKATFSEDRILMLFLQLLGAVGKYVKAQKANAHPDAIKLLNSIYTSLEIVSMSEGMTEAERKRILRGEIARFQSLKEELARRKKPGQSNAGDETATAAGPAAKDLPPALRTVLEEVRRTIRTEFAALKEELKSRTL